MAAQLTARAGKNSVLVVDPAKVRETKQAHLQNGCIYNMIAGTLLSANVHDGWRRHENLVRIGATDEPNRTQRCSVDLRSVR